MNILPFDKAIRRSIKGWGFKYQVPLEAQEAVDAGIAFFSDPTWYFSDDPHVCNGISLTERGEALARERGYECKCNECFYGLGENKKRGLAIPDGQLRGYCSMCFSSGSQYGFHDGACGFHYIGKHPEVLEERRRRKDSRWFPEGVKRTAG